jgi:hypothetical protein
MTRLHESTPGTAAEPFLRGSNRLWRLALVLAIVLQLIALYLPRAPAGPRVTGLDKVVHVCIFAAPALAALMAGIRARWVLGVLTVHAPVSELIQHFALPQRSGDVFDVMADCAGIALGWLAYLVWNRRQP